MQQQYNRAAVHKKPQSLANKVYKLVEAGPARDYYIEVCLNGFIKKLLKYSALLKFLFLPFYLI